MKIPPHTPGTEHCGHGGGGSVSGFSGDPVGGLCPRHGQEGSAQGAALREERRGRQPRLLEGGGLGSL